MPLGVSSRWFFWGDGAPAITWIPAFAGMTNKDGVTNKGRVTK